MSADSYVHKMEHDLFSGGSNIDDDGLESYGIYPFPLPPTYKDMRLRSIHS